MKISYEVCSESLQCARFIEIKQAVKETDLGFNLANIEDSAADHPAASDFQQAAFPSTPLSLHPVVDHLTVQP